MVKRLICRLFGHKVLSKLIGGDARCRRCGEQFSVSPFTQWLDVLRNNWPDIANELPSKAYRDSCEIAGVRPINGLSPNKAALHVLPGLRKAIHG